MLKRLWIIIAILLFVGAIIGGGGDSSSSNKKPKSLTTDLTEDLTTDLTEDLTTNLTEDLTEDTFAVLYNNIIKTKPLQGTIGFSDEYYNEFLLTDITKTKQGFKINTERAVIFINSWDDENTSTPIDAIVVVAFGDPRQLMLPSYAETFMIASSNLMEPSTTAENICKEIDWSAGKPSELYYDKLRACYIRDGDMVNAFLISPSYNQNPKLPDSMLDLDPVPALDFMPDPVLDPVPAHQQSNIQPSAQPSTNNRADTDIAAARRAFVHYHSAITDRAYREAYSMLSSAQRQRVGDFDSWVVGYQTTLDSTVDNLELIDSGDGYCVFKYKMIARDRYSNEANPRGVKVQMFDGEVTMIKVDGQWIIDRARSTKIGERLE